jgi:hypothetical protein
LPVEPGIAIVEHALETVECEEAFAHVVSSASTVLASPAGHNEARYHRGAYRWLLNPSPHRFHGPRDFVPQDRRLRKGDFVLDHVQVGVADPASRYPDQNLPRLGFRNRDLLDPQASLGSIQNRRPHQIIRHHESPPSPRRVRPVMPVASFLSGGLRASLIILLRDPVETCSPHYRRAPQRPMPWARSPRASPLPPPTTNSAGKRSPMPFSVNSPILHA